MVEVRDNGQGVCDDILPIGSRGVAEALMAESVSLDNLASQ